MAEQTEKTGATFNPSTQRRCLITGNRIPKGEPVLMIRLAGDQCAAISRDGLATGVEKLTALVRETNWLGLPTPKQKRRKTAAAS